MIVNHSKISPYKNELRVRIHPGEIKIWRNITTTMQLEIVKLNRQPNPAPREHLDCFGAIGYVGQQPCPKMF